MRFIFNTLCRFPCQVLIIGLFTFVIRAMGGTDPALESKVNGWMQNPGGLRFLENKGQMEDLQGKPVDDLLFETSGGGADMYITSWGLSYVFVKRETYRIPPLNNSNKLAGPGIRENENSTIQYCRADMELVGAEIKKENCIKESESEDRIDYYLGHCPEGVMNVHNYGKITIKNIYPGIDWVLYQKSQDSGLGIQELGIRNKDLGSVGGLKYDFIVHPGADPSLIKLRYKWTDKPALLKDGSVKISTPMGDILEGAPESYVQGKEQKVNTQYVLLGNNEIGFKVNKYNPEDVLIIDPALIWATYFGIGKSNQASEGASIHSDKTNVWVTGSTSINPFPTLNPGGAYFLNIFAGADLVFISQFTISGILVWSTYYGGGKGYGKLLVGNNGGLSINSDGANVWVTGSTNATNFPTLNPLGGAYYQPMLGPGDSVSGSAFILQFTTSGVRKWATYYGGNASLRGGGDFGSSIYSDGINVWVTGTTGSTDFPILNPLGGVYYQPFNGGAQDAFVLQFTTSGVRKWATYYGGGANDQGFSINSDGNYAWVTGYTASGDFPTQNLPGAYNQPVLIASQNAFILQFAISGICKWATYYGGSKSERGASISSDGKNVWVTGNTSSKDLPTVNPGGGAYFQGGLSAGAIINTFILQFNVATSACHWATYYGGSVIDQGTSISSDGKNVWVYGNSSSSDFPTRDPGCGSFFQGALEGGDDVFLLEFTTSGIRKWATYCGSDNALPDDRDGCISSDGTNVFAIWDGANTKGQPDCIYPIVTPTGAYHNGASTLPGETVYIAKFCTSCSPLNLAVSPPDTVCSGSSATLTANGALSYSWKPLTGLSLGTAASVTANPISTTTYTVIGSSGAGCSDSAFVTVDVLPAINVDAKQDASTTCGSSNGSASVTAIGGTGTLNYSWSTHATSTTILGLAAGIYTVTVNDNKGCTITSTATITNSDGPVITPPGTIIAPLCYGGNGGSAGVSVSGGAAPLTYSWNNGASTATATNLTAGVYTVTVSDASGCTAVSTLEVTQPQVLTPAASQQTEATCMNSDGAAIASVSGGTGTTYAYSWSNSVTGASNTGIAAGIYTVTITDANGCTITTTATITSDGPTVTAVSTNTCQGKKEGTITLSTTGTSDTYLWSNGALGLSAMSLDTGVYSITITDANGCSVTTSASVVFFPDLTVDVSPDKIITRGEHVQLSAGGGIKYLWQPPAFLNNDTIYNPIADPNQTTYYKVTITDGNSCSASDSVLVTVINCIASEIFIPTAFSPNGDGQNDMLYVRGPDCLTQLHLQVFDRWGEMVFETSSIGTGWNGIFKGKTMDAGVFVYSLTATLSNGQTISKKGNVTLLK